MPEIIPILVAAPAQPGVPGLVATRPPVPGGLASFKSSLRQALQRGHAFGLVMPVAPSPAGVPVAAVPTGPTALPGATQAAPAAPLPEGKPAAPEAEAQPRPTGAAEIALVAQEILAASATAPPQPEAPAPSLEAGAKPIAAETNGAPPPDAGAVAGAGDSPRPAPGVEGPPAAPSAEVAAADEGAPRAPARAAQEQPSAPKAQHASEGEVRKSDEAETRPGRFELPAEVREHLRVAAHVNRRHTGDEQDPAATPRESTQAEQPAPQITTTSSPDTAPARGEGRAPGHDPHARREAPEADGRPTPRVAVSAGGAPDFEAGRLVRVAADNAVPAVTPTSTEVRPAPVERQVVEALRILPRGDGQHEVRMRLNPPELGEVSVRMVVKEGSASVFMSTQTDAAREAIQSALPQLRDVLESRDLRAQELHVALDGSKTGSQMPDGQRRERREEQQPEAAAPWAMPLQAKRARRERVRVGQLDVMA